MTNAWGEVGMGMLVIDWAIKNILGQIMATISFICIIPSINNKRSMLRIRSPMATRTQGDLPVEGPSSWSHEYIHVTTYFLQYFLLLINRSYPSKFERVSFCIAL